MPAQAVYVCIYIQDIFAYSDAVQPQHLSQSYSGLSKANRVDAW
jgi:hypothetical protein